MNMFPCRWTRCERVLIWALMRVSVSVLVSVLVSVQPAGAAATATPATPPAIPGSPESPPLTSAPSADPVMTLGEAWRAAWGRSPVQRAFDARREQHVATVGTAQALTPSAPTLSVGTLNDRLNRNAGRQEWEAQISVPLWRAGQRGTWQRLAAAQAARFEHDTRLRQLDLARELRTQWWAAAAAQQAAALAQAQVQAATALHDDVARRHRAGDLARTDANTAAVELGMAQAAWQEALLGEAAARGRLRLLTGARGAASLQAEAPEGASGVAPPPTLAEALALAVDHPRHAAARAVLEAAQAKLAAAGWSGREAPEVALRLVRERSTFAERHTHTVGVQFSVPLASPPARVRDHAEARAEVLEAETLLAQVGEAIALDIETAYQQRSAAAARQALADRRVALSADTLRLQEKSFSLGETDLASLLRSRAAAHAARAEHALAAIAHAAALSDIQQALGVLP